MIAEADDLLFLLCNSRTRLVIGIVRVGNQRVEPVVSSRKLNYYEYRIILARRRLHGEVLGLRMELRKGAFDKHRHRPCRGGTEHGRAEKFAAGFHGI